MKQWSRKYKDCVQCGGNGRTHKGKGLCIRCYDKLRKKTPQSQLMQKKYRLSHRKEIGLLQKAFHYRNREKLLNSLGNKCKRCGFTDRRALQIDHINGGGIKERQTVNTKDFHRIVLKSITNKENKYQLLCANCNWIKRSENKEWGRTPKKYI